MESADLQMAIASVRYGRAGKAIGRLFYWMNKAVGRAQYDSHRLEKICGARILIAPSVFNPKLLRTGQYFAEQIAARAVGIGADVLDMGTGSGVCAVIAARIARRVVAVDLNSAAVRCAQINALLNSVDHKVEVRHGDLFAPVIGDRFDVVLFNPPFLRGAPRNERDFAWRSQDAIERFASQLPSHLNPGGYGLVLLSSFGDAPEFVAEFYRHRYRVDLLARREYFNETLAILKVTPFDAHN